MTHPEKQTLDYPWLTSYPEGVQWDQSFTPLPLYHLLDQAVELYPSHTALSFAGRDIDYHHLGRLIDHTTRGLQDLGVTKGTKIGLFLPNSPHYVILYYAILKAGGIVVNFNPLYPLNEIKNQIADSGATLMVTLDLKVLLGKIQSIAKDTAIQHIIVGKVQDFLPFPQNLLFPILKRNEICPLSGREIIPLRPLLHNHGKPDAVTILPEDTALLQYTGGTTGIAKAAVLSHANLYANTLQCSAWFHELGKGTETILAVLPFFHVFAMTAILNLGISIGAKLVIHPRFQLERVLQSIAKDNISVLVGVPTIFSAINHSHFLDKYDLSSLKMAVSGGAPLPLEVKTTFEKRTHCPVVEGYGLTETSPVLCVNPVRFHDTQEEVTGAAGLPLPDTIITIRSIENTATVLPQGKIGEICAIGPQVMKEYFHNPEETALVMQDGVLRTGDMGFLDNKGYLHIVDRLKEMIISGGYNIYPRHVEEALYRHPAIEEAAVIAQEDTNRGQVPIAYIAFKKDQTATKEELRDFLKSHLSPIEIPREFHIKESLPKTQIGKISKKDLKK